MGFPKFRGQGHVILHPDFLIVKYNKKLAYESMYT